jgi:hypothetical protein
MSPPPRRVVRRFSPGSNVARRASGGVVSWGWCCDGDVQLRCVVGLDCDARPTSHAVPFSKQAASKHNTQTTATNCGCRIKKDLRMHRVITASMMMMQSNAPLRGGSTQPPSAGRRPGVCRRFTNGYYCSMQTPSPACSWRWRSGTAEELQSKLGWVLLCPVGRYPGFRWPGIWRTLWGQIQEQGLERGEWCG